MHDIPRSPQERGVLATIEHTALASTTTSRDVDRLCDEALHHGFAGVCVATCRLAQVRRRLEGRETLAVAVVGFPLGSSTTATKAFETGEAVRLGADEIDMVVSLGRLKEGDWLGVERDIRAVVEAARGHPVKAILETAVLDADETRRAALAAKHAGAAFVKTSTGFGPGGATVEAVRLLRETVGAELGVKASGGIRTLEAARALLAAGADRLGTSSGVAIATALGSDTGRG